MPEITVGEKWNGQRQTLSESPQQDNGYLIFGTDDPSEAQIALLQYVPKFWQVGPYPLPIQTCEITDRIGETIYEGHVVWAWNPPQEEGDELLSFDTTGSTTKVLQSLQTIQRYPAPGFTAPDYNGAIGVNEDGNVEGVDIPIPGLQITRQRRFAADFVTNAYLDTLSELTGMKNLEPFMGFPAGELRFDGANGQQKLGKPWDITFKFTRSRNVTGLTVGPITGINKGGWDYMWFKYRTQQDTTSRRLVQVVMAAYVEKVIEDGDFGRLGVNL